MEVKPGAASDGSTTRDKAADRQFLIRLFVTTRGVGETE